MNLNHLTDTELIQYIIRHDDDSIRVRLAGIMDRMPGRIIEGLERAGMDPDTCLHENLYESGEYIEHLNNEIECLHQEVYELRGKLAERETMTVAELIKELHGVADLAHSQVAIADRRVREAEKEVETTRAKMKVWRALTEDVK